MNSPQRGAAYGVLSSSNVYGRFRQLGANAQYTEFLTLILEREQLATSGAYLGNKQRALRATPQP